MSSVSIKPSLHATRSGGSTHYVGVDSILLGVFISLLLLGLVMVFSSTVALGEQKLAVNTDHLWRQIQHMGLGVAIALIVANIPVWAWQRASIGILAFSIVLLILPLVFGAEIKGSQRWVSLWGMSFQPAEVAKLTMVIYAASYLTRKQAQLQNFKHGIINIGLVLGVLGLLLLAQPDFGSFFVITVVIGLMMFIGGIRVSHTLLCLAIAAGVMSLLVFDDGYRSARIAGFLDPWSDPQNGGYQLIQSLIALGRGEIFGVGLGASIQKLNYLPHADNDFILAIIGEELGLVGVVLVIALFALLLHRALIIARTAELIGRIYAARLAQGIGFLLVIQAIINIGVNLGALPTKGLTLPFISYGGSSLLVCSSAMGLLFAVDRQNRVRKGINSEPKRGSKSPRLRLKSNVKASKSGRAST